jgi:uncharacterized cupin superfamily protein
MSDSGRATLNLLSTPHQELRSPTGEAFSLSAILSDAVGFKDIFVHHDIIPPGRRSSGKHAHSHREEMIVVLKGQIVTHIGSKAFTLNAGDYMGFSPGEVHFAANEGETPAEVLVIASNPVEDRVSY